DSGVSGDGSLRGEIAGGGGDTIVFDQDCVITLGGGGTLTLIQDITIDGAGHHVIVDGGCTFSGGVCTGGGGGVFSAIPPQQSSLTGNLIGLTIRHGSSSSGGGVFVGVGAVMTITDCTITENSALTGNANGGGLANSGNLAVINSTVSGNSA